MFKNFFGEESMKDNGIEQRFGEIKSVVSPAKLQNYLLKYKGQPKDALDNMLLLRQEGPQIFGEDRTTIYRCTNDYGPTWEPFGDGKPMRPWNTIITQDNIKEKILDDLKDFLSSKEFYRQRGITHRKGYLFHGPPGTGKSTLMAALADKLRYNICMIELNTNEMSDSHLMTLLSKIPRRSIVVIEDIDVALPSTDRRIKLQKEREKKGTYESPSKVTLSGALNALDGIFTADSQIVFMTTNYIDHLDSALVRPGRIDRKYYLGNCNKDQVKDMITEAYPNTNDFKVEELAELIDSLDNPVSPASLECYMLRNRLSLEDAIQNIGELKSMAKENAEKELFDRSPTSLDDHPESNDETTEEYEEGVAKSILQEIKKDILQESTEQGPMEEIAEKGIVQRSVNSPDEYPEALHDADDKLYKEREHESLEECAENKIANSLNSSADKRLENTHDTNETLSKKEEYQNLEENSETELVQRYPTDPDDHSEDSNTLDDKLCNQEESQILT